MWKSLDQNKFHLIIAFRSECALKGSYALQASLPLLASMKLYPSFKICLLMHMEEKERQNTSDCLLNQEHSACQISN